MNDSDPGRDVDPEPYRSPAEPDNRADPRPEPGGRPGVLGVLVAEGSCVLIVPLIMMGVGLFAGPGSYAPFTVLALVGLLQWLWLAPIWLWLRRRQEPRMARALALTGLVNLLLWGGCTGLFVFQP